MKEDPIGLLDSGLGGITILEEVRTLLPNENYLYYGDSLYNPYGEKTKEEVTKRVKWIIEHLLEKGCKMIIIACNTATAEAIDEMRKTFFVPIVGTFPALKVAMDQEGPSNILLMATPGTIQSKKFAELKEATMKPDKQLFLLPCPSLANKIEKGNREEIKAYLKELFSPFASRSFDQVVLGCTHYPLIKEEIASFFPKATLIHGGIGIARRVKTLLEEKEIKNPSLTEGIIEVENSKGEEMVTRTYQLLKMMKEKNEQ